MISTARADYRSNLASSLVVNFHVILLLFIKAVEAERKQKFSPSHLPFEISLAAYVTNLLLVTVPLFVPRPLSNQQLVPHFLEI